MNGAELKTFVDEIAQETLDETLFLTLLNIAKNEVEESREWEILKTWDRTLTYSPGDTYLTEKSLPALFRNTYGDGIIYIGEDNPYLPVPFKDLYRYRSFGNRYSIDYRNNKLHILGSESASAVINLPFLTLTADIALDTSWEFPSRFHGILGFMVLGYFTAGVDADDIYARMSPAHRVAAAALLGAMEKWNTRMALMAMGNSSVSDQNDVGSDGRIVIDR